jgi:hypothetical protein
LDKNRGEDVVVVLFDGCKEGTAPLVEGVQNKDRTELV